MSVFAVLTDPGNHLLTGVIKAKFPNDHFDLQPGQFLVSSPASTARELSEQLTIPGGTVGTGLVLSLAGYFGRQRPEVWEWLKTKWGANGSS